VALGHARVVLDVAPENARAARFYANQGFTFLDEWEALASHPHIRVRKMAWLAPATA
jgi:ribosomal protein S18 acetylase RimI-like enzyme